MLKDDVSGPKEERAVALADRAFGRFELFAYIVLGALLAATALLGIVSAAVSLWQALQQYADSTTLVMTIDRLLFVLMVAEILHTVRVSFRSGSLVSEPFLVVGLIASIRRVLVITLESSQASQPGNWTPQAHEFFNATMIELTVMTPRKRRMIDAIAHAAATWDGKPKVNRFETMTDFAKSEFVGVTA